MNKITMALAFGAGYVVGARAGRERYREIRDRARAVWQSEPVQEQAAKAQEAARSGASRAGDAAKTQLARAQDAAKDKLPAPRGGHTENAEAVPEPGAVGP